MKLFIVVFFYFLKLKIINSQLNVNTDLCNLNNYQHCLTLPAYRYRTLAGDCNNLEKPWLGKCLTPMKRFNGGSVLYEDSTGKPRRTALSGKPLPNSRKVAMAVHFPQDLQSDVTVFHVLYGQMISHDLALSPQPQDSTGRNIVCFCNDTNNPLCLLIPTSPDDTINQDQSCMATPRTISVNMNCNCRNSPREQINKLTAWLDMSHIYGNNDAMANNLRSKTDSGFLETKKLDGMKREVFPFGPSGPNQCLRDTAQTPCFQSGEGRTNENTGLTSIQVLFLRQHNLIAQILKDFNGWAGENLYQRTRRILIALYQQILYNEYLEVVIGKSMMNRYNLWPLRTGYFYGYNSRIVPQIINEFTTAAFRFGHNMVPSQMHKSDENLNNYRIFDLSNLTFTPTAAFSDGGLDAICRGTIKNPGLLADNHFSNALHNHLFDVGVPLGDSKRNSLSAFNIERGRDHGLRTYVSYRSSVGLPAANKFEDLTYISPGKIAALKSVYEVAGDIDLFAGGSCEDNLPGAQVGPTFATIIATQFSELKIGDRFYYENDFDTLTNFNPAQLTEIRKMTIARLICDNLDVNTIQKNPFYVANPLTNPLVSCNDIPTINYKVFKLRVASPDK